MTSVLQHKDTISESEKVIEDWELNRTSEQDEPINVGIARHFLSFFTVVSQASDSKFQSVAGNGLVKSAIAHYRGEEI